MLKIKEGFILRQIAGENIVVPSGKDLDLNMMINLNDTGRFLWEHMQKETTEQALTAALLEEYDVTEEKAKASVAAFIEKLRGYDVLA